MAKEHRDPTFFSAAQMTSHNKDKKGKREVIASRARVVATAYLVTQHYHATQNEGSLCATLLTSHHPPAAAA